MSAWTALYKRALSLFMLSTPPLISAITAPTPPATSQATDYQMIEDKSGLKILSPTLADRKVVKLRLNNGMDVMLISDPGIDKSGAALSVEVGSWQDPENRYGMAHFLEHMLFMGSATYPDENGFMNYLGDYQGSCNAFTADQCTVYMFAVNTNAFSQALDRFAHFFIDPSLHPEAMGREQHAVDQEFARAMDNDNWRIEMVMKENANQQHPASRFNCGSVKTLQGISYDEIKKWLESHYSANLMHLVLYSPLPMDQLISLATQDFKNVPNRHLSPFSFTLPQFTPEMKGKMLYVTPVKDLKQLILTWELPYSYSTIMETHAPQLVAAALGDESEHSLLALLKSQGLAEQLSAAPSAFNRADTHTYFFNLTIDLTDQGIQNKEAVINACFQAIKYYQQTGIPRYIYDEVQTVNRLNYEYQSRHDVFTTVRENAYGLTQEDLATYPSQLILASKYDPEAMQALLQQLTPEQCYYTLVANPKLTKVTPTMQESWMGTMYAVQSLPPAMLRSWQTTPLNADIATPAVNPFIPQDLKVTYQGASTTVIPHPTPLLNDHYGLIYYAEDKQYLVPEVSWTFNIKSARIQAGNPKDAVLTDLFVRSVNESLTAAAYQAQTAGLSYHLSPAYNGINVSLSGFSEKAPLLFKDILTQLRQGIPTREQFVIYKNSLIQAYQNSARETPFVQASALLQELLYKDTVSDAARLKAIKMIEYHDLVSFFDSMFEKAYIEGMFYGNLDSNSAAALVQQLRSTVKSPFPEGRLLKPQVVLLPANKGPFFLSHNIKVQGIAALLAIEESSFSFENRAAQQILGTAMQEPFFSTLRTKQQTGYVAKSFDRDLESQLFQLFVVQSNSHDGRDLIARFELFIEEFLQGFHTSTLPEAQFNTIKEAHITSLKQPPKNMDEMSALLFKLAFEQEGDFDWIEKRIKGFEQLTYQQLATLAHEWLGKANKRRIALIVRGKIPSETSLQYERAASLKRLRDLSVYRRKNSATKS